MLRTVFIAVTLPLLVLWASCSSKGIDSLDDSGHAFSKAVDTIALEYVEDDYRILDGLVEMEKEKVDGLVTVKLKITEDCTVNRLYYDLRFNSSLIHTQEAEMESLLGRDGQFIEIVSDRIPGVLSFGQVSPGLADVQLEEGQLLATAIFAPGPQKVTSAASATDIGLKLRAENSVEFINSDVPFTVYWRTDNGLEITWEEANDGDLNGDGQVYSSDLTPIGQLWDDRLVHTASPPGYMYSGYSRNDTDQTFSINRDPEQEAERHFKIKRIGVMGDGTTRTNDYVPVVRKSSGQSFMTWSSNFEDDVYIVDNADLGSGSI